MSTSSSQSPDVLVVDDDPSSIAAVAGALSTAGYSVATAAGGMDALRLVADSRPRMLVLDVQLPDVDGLSVCRQLHAEAATRDIPVMFLSSSVAPASRVVGLRSGAIDYLGKPCDLEELVARVAVQLEALSERTRVGSEMRLLESINQSLRSSIMDAGRIQLNLLPHGEFDDPRIDFGWSCIPRGDLGGDGADIIRLSDDLYALYVLDASGHGVPASLLAVAAGYLTATFVDKMRSRSTRGCRPSPASVIAELNDALRPRVPSGRFVSALIATIDLRRSVLTFCSAGHPGPLIVTKGTTRYCDQPALPTGIADWQYTDSEVPIAVGDRILFYSDGVFEQRNAVHEPFGRGRVARAMVGCEGKSAGQSVHTLTKSIDEWRGSRELDDDLTAVVAEIRACGSRLKAQEAV